MPERPPAKPLPRDLWLSSATKIVKDDTGLARSLVGEGAFAAIAA